MIALRRSWYVLPIEQCVSLFYPMEQKMNSGQKVNHCYHLSIKLLFSRLPHDSLYLLSQTKFYPTITATRLCLLKPSGNSKIMVRNHNLFSILQFVHSPFFQLNRCVQGEPAIHRISSHRPNFASPSPPSACIY